MRIECKERRQSGAAIIEFSLVFPLLTIFTAFLVNVAVFLFEMIVLSDAVRYGARAGFTHCINNGFSGIETAAQNAADRYLSSDAQQDIFEIHSFANWGKDGSLYEKFNANRQSRWLKYRWNGSNFNIPVGFLTVDVPLKPQECAFCLRDQFRFGLPEHYSVWATTMTSPGCTGVP